MKGYPTLSNDPPFPLWPFLSVVLVILLILGAYHGGRTEEVLRQKARFEQACTTWQEDADRQKDCIEISEYIFSTNDIRKDKGR